MSEPNSQKPFFTNSVEKKSEQLYNTQNALDASNRNKHKGNTNYTDENGKRYSRGFTPPVAFVAYPGDRDIDGLPKELGVEVTNNFTSIDTSDIQGNIYDNFYFFNDQSGYEFLHKLDNEVYLTSYSETNSDNEDPISFGYDFIINFNNSPLFNGGIENFLESQLYIGYEEITSRLRLITEFKRQFFKFFKTDSPISVGQNFIPRTYYLKSLAGLSQLTENINGEKIKQFTDYDKEFLTLTLNEDVSVNMGYLVSLYKTLSYSKVHGKKMIPDNLLRFDLDIIVTEMRKYNRVYNRNSDGFFNYSDGMSKYRYKLYECQFIFDKMTHDDAINMSEPGINTGFDLKINYKFTTMKFEKFLDQNSILNDNGSISRKQNFVNNAKININSDRDSTGKSDSEDIGFVVRNGSIELLKNDKVLYPISGYFEFNNKQVNYQPDNLQYSGEYSSTIDALDANAKSNRKSSLNKLLEKTKDNIISSANNSLQNAIYTIKQELYAFVPTNFVGGFTEDGWQYNIPAYYTNKAINTTRNVLQKTLQTVRGDIYAVANSYKLQFLNNINNGINQGTNLLNNSLGKISGSIDRRVTGNSAGINTKTKPNNIYGN